VSAAPTEQDVLTALSHIQDPDLGRDVVSLGMIKNLAIGADGKVDFTFELTTPACPVRDRFHTMAEEIVSALPGVTAVEVKMTANVRPAFGNRPPAGEMLPGVRQTIAVASGKGGVGKSTVAVNLAVALARSGARVGLLDADVYGPNIPRMMGVNEPPMVINERIIPLEAHGVKVISIGFLIDRDQPAIWRGPIVMKIITQFLRDVAWGELDYFIVDMPPGTGDAQLSLVQATQVTAAIIVTTPQEVSVGDALRGAKMFERVNVPVVGVVENMSWFECPHCGKPTA